MIWRYSVALAALAMTAPATGRAQKAKDEVLAAGQALFDGMAKRDTAALRALLHPSAQFVATTEGADSVTVRVTSRDDFLRAVGSSTQVLIERMWNSEVRISGPIATIWTPYDFHAGTTRSHCGIDAFQLVKAGQGWKITSIIYTVVPEANRCPASPLGPVK
jgi:hypothetical protein